MTALPAKLSPLDPEILPTTLNVYPAGPDEVPIPTFPSAAKFATNLLYVGSLLEVGGADIIAKASFPVVD